MPTTLQTFGGGTTDFILDPSNNAAPAPNTPYTVIDAVTMAAVTTGLLDALGNAVTQLASDTTGRYAGSAPLQGSAYYLDTVGANGLTYRFGPMVTISAVAGVADLMPQLGTIATRAENAETAAAAAQTAAEAAAAGATAPAATAIDTRLGGNAQGILDPASPDTKRVLTVAAGNSTFVARWKANTAYTLGQPAIAPDGTLVKANAAFTSGATYNPANWTATAGAPGTQVDRVVTATVASGTYTADLTAGDIFVLNLTGNATLAFSGLVAGRSFVVEVQQDATGGRVLTLPTAGGPAVTLATTAGTFETLVYYSLDGTTLRVRKVGAGTGSGPAPAWTPASMADKLARFNATDLSGADGTIITSWADSFAVMGAATQTDPTLQPTLQTVNGRRVVRFALDKLTTATLGTVNSAPKTIAYVVKYGSTSGSQSVFYGASGQVGTYLAAGTIGAIGSSYLSSGVAPNLAAFQTVVIVFNGAASKIRVDGVEVTGNMPSATLSQLNLGNNAAATAAFAGDIAEMIVVGHASDATEITNIETYLATVKADLAS